MKKIIIGFLCFLIAGGAGFVGVQYFTKTGLFKIPGKLLFSESFPDLEAEKIQERFAETELEADLTLSYTVEPKAVGGENYYLQGVFVPTTDFYSTVESITSDEFRALYEERDPSVVSIDKLDSSVKLLSVDGDYYLDEFGGGALFKYLRVEGENTEDLGRARELLEGTVVETPNGANTLTFAQTGVTALSRRMNTKLAEVGTGAYFAEQIGGYLSSFDLTHTSNESSFTELATGSNICSKPKMIEALTAIGLDIVELTGNHNVDCGVEAARGTVDKYDELGIKTVGGGRNAEEAAVPLEIAQKGTNITMLGYNQSTGGATTGSAPGANQYSEADARVRITEAKARGDIVIVDMQYYECNEYDYSYENTTCDRANSSAGDQIGVFRSLIDMGADVVVGTSAHQTQTFERYGEGEIYYGLGNLFFDQSWWPGTTRSLGLVHYFWKGRLLQTRRFGTVYDDSLQTRLMNEEELAWFIDRLNQARP